MDLAYSLMWTALFALFVAGLVLFVVAVVRWRMNSWKYLLLALILPLAPVMAVVGWVALFAGGLRTTKAPADR